MLSSLKILIYRYYKIIVRRIQFHKKIKKAVYLRNNRDKYKKKYGLNTQFDFVINTLEQRKLIDTSSKALEVFGWHGLNITVDYAPYCESVDLYDIDPMIIKYAKKIHRKRRNNINPILGNSIELINNGKLDGRYNFISIDSPNSVYDKYCEHFDIFPNVFNCLKNYEGIIVIGVITNAIHFYSQSNDEKNRLWNERRKEFYNISNAEYINPNFLLKYYIEIAKKNNFLVSESIYVNRGLNMGFVVLSLNK
tara:strand:+ start:1456 stop:2208 length:753 start_codon:yes stop_codon:yes gene_type:complete